jgi:hypothetical protein
MPLCGRLCTILLTTMTIFEWKQQSNFSWDLLFETENFFYVCQEGWNRAMQAHGKRR